MEYMNKVKINNNFRLIIKLINSKLMNRLYRRDQQKVMMIINHVRKFIFYMLFTFHYKVKINKKYDYIEKYWFEYYLIKKPDIIERLN